MPVDATCFKDDNNSLNQEKDMTRETKMGSDIDSNKNNNKKTAHSQSNSIKVYDLIAFFL